jgi:hypothetical protein
MSTDLDFRAFFGEYGESLLNGWLRAIQDGYQESFTDWITGEYDMYLEPALRCAGCGSIVEEGEPWDYRCDNCMVRSEPVTEDYEVPYHGLLDEPSVIETAINTRLTENRRCE